MINKQQIQNALRVYGSEGVKNDTLQTDFYVYVNEFENNYKSIWGDFSQNPELNLRDSRKIIVHFPIRCPKGWLDQKIQDSKFIVMFRGATTPFGYYSTLKGFPNVERGIDFIEEVRTELKEPSQYGIHALYLGRRVK